jgi:hypothetical protein
MKVTTSVIAERKGRFSPEPIDFKEINMKADIMTAFEYDDQDLTKVTFIYEDANGKLNPQPVDLAKFGLDVNYILETVRA